MQPGIERRLKALEAAYGPDDPPVLFIVVQDPMNCTSPGRLRATYGGEVLDQDEDESAEEFRTRVSANVRRSGCKLVILDEVTQS